ncbi:MAG TPA: serine hydrolase domain-containing protein, partial [bacterium]|nr:serine hydrolase domain-containing protein [bacterium]
MSVIFLRLSIPSRADLSNIQRPMRINHIYRLLNFVFVFAVFAGTGSSAQTDDSRGSAAELDSILATLHADGLFNGTLAISEGDKIVYRAAFGEYEGEPVTTRTPIYLVSVSKAMAAAAVLSLVTDGRIALDKPVGDYVRPCPYREVTVRHLLNQTSGLHFFSTITAYHDTTKSLTSHGLLALIDEHKPDLAFEPGTEFAYDNANYAVLGALLEAVTGRSYSENLRERVFEPAGLTSAFVAPSGEADWIGWVGGDGNAVHASAEDLLTFDYAFRTGKIVPPDLIREAESPPTLPGGAESRYGFGRFLTDDPRPLIGHFGEGTNAKTGLWRERETGTTYAILMPGDDIRRTAILGAVMALWNGKPYELPRARKDFGSEQLPF